MRVALCVFLVLSLFSVKKAFSEENRGVRKDNNAKPIDGTDEATNVKKITNLEQPETPSTINSDDAEGQERLETDDTLPIICKTTFNRGNTNDLPPEESNEDQMTSEELSSDPEDDEDELSSEDGAHEDESATYGHVKHHGVEEESQELYLNVDEKEGKDEESNIEGNSLEDQTLSLVDNPTGDFVDGSDDDFGNDPQKDIKKEPLENKEQRLNDNTEEIELKKETHTDQTIDDKDFEGEKEIGKGGDQNEGQQENDAKPHQDEQSSRVDDGKGFDALPNVVIFLADDVGYGDIGAFGNDTIRTPNIDSIASQGAKFTHHLTASATCTPSRSALLTGRYPIRLGLATRQIMSAFPFVSGVAGMPSEEVTFAEILKRRGYETGLIGKWHLGLSHEKLGDHHYHPNNQGFDYFYGTPQSNFEDLGRKNKPSLAWQFMPSMDWFRNCLLAVFVCAVTSTALRFKKFIKTPCWLVMVIVPAMLLLLLCMTLANIRVWNGVFFRNSELVEQPIDLNNMSKRLVNEGEDFLKARSKDKKPFLLFMSWLQCHTALHASKEFKDRSVHGKYGAEVEEMDWSTGQILNSLQQYGFTNNTFVYFSSDNGGHFELHEDGERAGGYNGIFRGAKIQGGQDGGIRVPTVAMWPGHIRPNTVIDVPTSQMDVLPTLANIVGETPPQDRVVDGRDITNLIRGVDTRPPHDFLFNYCGIWMHAARWSPSDSTDVWKVYYALPNWVPGTYTCSRTSFYACTCRDGHTWLKSPILYNIAKDPSETTPMDTSKTVYSNIVSAINEAKRKHEKTIIPVPNQFDVKRIFFRPWMQPCCNFPYCQCKDPKYNKA